LKPRKTGGGFCIATFSDVVWYLCVFIQYMCATYQVKAMTILVITIITIITIIINRNNDIIYFFKHQNKYHVQNWHKHMQIMMTTKYVYIYIHLYIYICKYYCIYLN